MFAVCKIVCVYVCVCEVGEVLLILLWVLVRVSGWLCHGWYVSVGLRRTEQKVKVCNVMEIVFIDDCVCRCAAVGFYMHENK